MTKSTNWEFTATGSSADWVSEHRSLAAEVLATQGIVVVRAAPGSPTYPGIAAEVRQALGQVPALSVDEFADRDDWGDGVYSAPHWAGDREMCPHHERGHSVVAPAVLVMCLQQRPASGGELVVADTRLTWQSLPERVQSDFLEHGWLAIRTYRAMFGRNWVKAFGTDDPDEVDRLAAQQDLEVQWLPDGAVRTSGVRPAVVRHPISGQLSWFNQLTFFSQWAIDPRERELLLSSFGADRIPMNSGRGDGQPLREADFHAVLDAYAANSRTIDLRVGDIVLLDNIRFAHGRAPYVGDRSVAVAPTGPVNVASVSASGPPRAGGHLE